MPYRNTCKKCLFLWVSPTENGAAKECPNCKATETVYIKSSLVEDKEKSPVASSEGEDPNGNLLEAEVLESAEGTFPISTPTTQFEPTDKASAQVERRPDLDVT